MYRATLTRFCDMFEGLPKSRERIETDDIFGHWLHVLYWKTRPFEKNNVTVIIRHLLEGKI